ncbi:cyclin-dependent kinase regulatory subunit CKS1 [Nematocida sp. AWRm80]|nr:cyclin-dependent kinase regulatory subunit CKS1 [Nematocida sp. AWRm80]
MTALDIDLLAKAAEKIYYSDTYTDDDNNMYRHVILPPEMVKYIPKDKLLEEHEWRSLRIMQSKGWVHYMIYKPEPHVLLFKKKLEQ